MLRVALINDFSFGDRLSLSLYGDNLAKSLEKYSSLQIDHIKPNWSYYPIFFTIFGKRISLYFARYFYYPIYILKISKNYDLVHILDQSYAYLLIFIPKKKTVITVHDIIPLERYRGLLNGISRGRYPLLYMMSLKCLPRADYIVSVSDATRKSLLKECSLKSIRMYGGPGIVFSSTKNEIGGEKEKKNLNILISGTNYYKNNIVALRSVAKFSNKYNVFCEIFWLTGGVDVSDRIKEFNYNFKIRINVLPALISSDMEELYKKIDCVLFPSLAEGFGLPVLESLLASIPVICSPIPIFYEVAGSSAIFPKGDGIDHYVESLRRVQTKSDLPLILLEQIKGKFCWDQLAENTFSLYKLCMKQ
jgi:glycosyltransferase involved in cell wall biosynthesis